MEENSDLELNVSSSDPRIRRKRASYIDYKIKGFFSGNNNIYNVSRYKQKELDERKSKKQDDYDWKNNYLLSLKDYYYDLDLSLDARIILEAEPSQQSRNSTVVFCVLLRGKNGYLKKFAFHNAISAMSGYMRAKAKGLGYDIILPEPLKNQTKNSLRNYELDLSADRFNNSP